MKSIFSVILFVTTLFTQVVSDQKHIGTADYRSFFAEDGLYSDKMKKTILDIVEDPLEDEARFFDYDRGAAFNTSVAFTIPLFSFTLPGAVETAETGIESNSFGVLAFASLFLLGGLGVAIYTTSQGGNEDTAFEERRIFDTGNEFSNRLLMNVYNALSGLPEALDVDSCCKLAICSAHAETQKYGLLSLPFKFLFPVQDEENSLLTSYGKAALYGYKNEDECYFEYPCIVHPLDTALYLKDYFLRK